MVQRYSTNVVGGTMEDVDCCWECINALFEGDLHHMGFVLAAPQRSSDGNGWVAIGTATFGVRKGEAI